jgi:hypothetical protein
MLPPWIIDRKNRDKAQRKSARTQPSLEAPSPYCYSEPSREELDERNERGSEVIDFEIP